MLGRRGKTKNSLENETEENDMRKMLSLMLAVFMIMSFVLTGCSVQPSDKPVVPAETNVKDSLVIATSAEPVRFFSCGPEASNSSDYIVLYNIYDTLVEMSPKGEILPALAKEWTVSEDGLSYTFKLRDDVYFHNGEKMTAKDVAYTMDYNSQTAIGKALLINYSHSEIIDDYTIKITLSKPFAPFINGMTSRAAQIINKAYMEEKGVETYLAAPIGTGPYKFVSRASGDTVTLQAFDDYWGGAPSIKKVYIKTMSDPTTQIVALQAGDVDVILSPAVSNMVKMDTSTGATWASCSSAARVTMVFNCNEGRVASDLNFRKAVQAATNKEDIVLGVMEGYGEVADIDMVTSYTGRPDTYKTVDYDVEAAKAYLKNSNYNNQEFTILVQSGTKNEAVAQILQAQLMDIGINCKINATDTATFNSVWYSGTGYDAIIRTSDSSLMDADCLAAYFLTSAAAAEKNKFEKLQELNDLLMKGRITQGTAERKAVYGEICDIITDEAYQVPFFYDVSVLAYNEKLAGVEPHPLFTERIKNWSWK